ncbi:hypothetical protein V6N12_025580 [Hibiscus sabdariffa]|uniref:Uncharacterized protein n=1 Tax=Hibiscus sabdariffa TaxID=183260 RepID=A0ABR2CIV5_9ROSI
MQILPETDEDNHATSVKVIVERSAQKEKAAAEKIELQMTKDKKCVIREVYLHYSVTLVAFRSTLRIKLPKSYIRSSREVTILGPSVFVLDEVLGCIFLRHMGYEASFPLASCTSSLSSNYAPKMLPPTPLEYHMMMGL